MKAFWLAQACIWPGLDGDSVSPALVMKQLLTLSLLPGED